MTKTGTQNRPYTAEKLMVTAIITFPVQPATAWTFDWNDREAVRRFAADSDRALRAGASTRLMPAE